MIRIAMRKRQHTLFYSLLLVLLGLVFLRYAMQINFPRFVLLIVAILTAVLGDRDEMIALCICCIPLYTSLQYVVVILVTVLLYLSKYGKTMRVNLSIVPVFLIAVWELIHCFRAGFSPVHFLGTMTPFVLYAVLMNNGNHRVNYQLVVRALALTTVAVCLVLLYKLLFASGFNVVATVANLRRLGMNQEEMVVAGGELNPNTLGIICVLAIAGLLQLRANEEWNRRDLSMVIFLMAFGTLTSSRTYLVCLLIMAVLFLFSQDGGIKEKFRFMVGVIVVTVVVVLLIYALFPELLEYYLYRFQVEDLSSGRSSLFAIYNEYIFNTPGALFMGIGVRDFGNRIVNDYDVAFNVPHNGIQEIVVAWGVPGLILFSILIAVFIWRGKVRAGKLTLLQFIPLIILLAKIQVGQVITSGYTMLAFAYVYLSLANDFGNYKSVQRARRLKKNGYSILSRKAPALKTEYNNNLFKGGKEI